LERRLLAGAESRFDIPERFGAAPRQRGRPRFYRVRYSSDLLERLLGAHADLAAIERFNLVNDAWAVTVAGLMALGDYLELTARFRGERDRNVWSVLFASFGTLNRLIDPRTVPRLAALVRDRVALVFGELGWTPRSARTN